MMMTMTRSRNTGEVLFLVACHVCYDCDIMGETVIISLWNFRNRRAIALGSCHQFRLVAAPCNGARDEVCSGLHHVVSASNAACTMLRKINERINYKLLYLSHAKYSLLLNFPTCVSLSIIIINDSIYPAVSKASRTGNKVSCQPNDCPNR